MGIDRSRVRRREQHKVRLKAGGVMRPSYQLAAGPAPLIRLVNGQIAWFSPAGR
jgi:hypothetical protein